MFCIHCGAPNPENASFCSTCGKAIGTPANPPLPAETSQRIPNSAEESSGNASVQSSRRMQLPTQPAPHPQPQLPDSAAVKGKPVLWILSGFAACLLIVIAVALGSRPNRPSPEPEPLPAHDNPVADSTPPAAPATYSPPTTAPAANDPPAPASAPVEQAPSPSPAPAPPQNSIVGTWKTITVVGTSIELHLSADGRYILRDLASDEGVYVFSTGDGTLRLQSNSIFSKGIMVWSCQLSGDSLSCVDPEGGGHVYTRE